MHKILFGVALLAQGALSATENATLPVVDVDVSIYDTTVADVAAGVDQMADEIRTSVSSSGDVGEISCRGINTESELGGVWGVTARYDCAGRPAGRLAAALAEGDLRVTVQFAMETSEDAPSVATAVNNVASALAMHAMGTRAEAVTRVGTTDGATPGPTAEPTSVPTDVPALPTFILNVPFNGVLLSTLVARRANIELRIQTATLVAKVECAGIDREEETNGVWWVVDSHLCNGDILARSAKTLFEGEVRYVMKFEVTTGQSRGQVVAGVEAIRPDLRELTGAINVGTITAANQPDPTVEGSAVVVSSFGSLLAVVMLFLL